MFIVIESDKKDIFFIGDIHGQFKAIGNWIKTTNLSGCIIVFCGDFGLGYSSVQFEESSLLRSNKICEEKNIDCYIVRGNHDDPSYFNTDIPKLNLSRIKTVSDYTVIQTPEHNILCVGGAVSIDRVDRQIRYEYDIATLMRRKHYDFQKAKKTAKLYWWDNEAFVYNETILDEIKKCNIAIDIIASHGAPTFCQPNNNIRAMKWAKLDPKLETDVNEERQNFSNLYAYLKEQGNNITHWFYGHYHQHNFEVIDGTKFIGLDMGRTSKYGGGPGGNFDMAQVH